MWSYALTAMSIARTNKMTWPNALLRIVKYLLENYLARNPCQMKFQAFISDSSQPPLLTHKIETNNEINNNNKTVENKNSLDTNRMLP